MAEHLPGRNVVIKDGRTSMRFEPEFWEALDEICEHEGIGLNELIQRIDARGYKGTRTSAVRVYVLQYFREGPP